MIAVLDYDLLNYTENTKKEFNALLDAVDSVKARRKDSETLLQPLHDVKNDLIKVNTELSLTTKTVVTPLHWCIIIGFALLTSLLILDLRTESWVSIIISGFLVIGVFEVLELLYVIDSNMFLADKIAYQSPQGIFQSIGQLNYYPETAIKNRWVKNIPSKYRIGIYKNYPRSFEKKIRVVSTKK